MRQGVYDRPYDKDGNPITLKEMIDLRTSDSEYYRVALDVIENIIISTVWLGINHAEDGAPLQIFETMVTNGNFDDGEIHRWSTKEIAIEAHRRLANRIKALVGYCGSKRANPVVS